MRRIRGFTLIELLVVIAIIALLIGILVPALGAAKKAANKMKNGTQVRGLVQSLIMWSSAQTTDDSFPRVINGTPIGNCNSDLVVTPTGTVGRINALTTVSTGDPLSPKLLINPASSIDVAATNATNLATNNCSYALLCTTNNEWKNLTNAGAPLVCDKGTNGGGSPWTPSGPSWTGNVGWGDVHTTFETTNMVNVTVGGNTSNNQPLYGTTGTSAIIQMMVPGQ
jgi:prepilin-type N-terminal cleavage/methylation domain-containing protein